jgi:hypothetical protein
MQFGATLIGREITGKPTEFPISTYRNGTIVGTSRLNFIEGTGISISASSANNRVNLTFTAYFSSAHTDTNPTSNTYLKYNGS